MLFNSFEFLLFFPVVAIAYFIVPSKYRWLLLLTASYYFYMSWKAEYLALIVISTLIDFFAAKGIENSNEKSHRNLLLSLSVMTNLGILFYFKYYNFFITEILALLNSMGFHPSVHVMSLALPVGISFYTFQTLSYTIDVYNNKMRAEKHLGIFALYVSYFPQLVAGPIERAKRLIPQLKFRKYIVTERITFGLKLALWGFFKKIVIADRLAYVVDKIYAKPDVYSGPELALGTLFFTFQIYCDFSGYSDIAIGISRIFGVKLMTNFRTPYFSKSIGEFWGRWHISLSTWFRDYLYIPLGGNRVNHKRLVFNLIFVFLISGFWHGANWTFIFWGLVHGIYLVLERFTKVKIPSILSQVKTFLLVYLGWIFFRSQNISDSWMIIKKITVFEGQFVFQEFISKLKVNSLEINTTLILLALFFAIDYIEYKFGLIKQINRLPKLTRYLVYAITVTMILIFGRFGETEFIYFQF